ncbi:MAG: iron-containing alcohol dehydrogenase [Lentisphaeria bacterium]|nr:iron-containing alcohol dehydrogenase [Lentisphaeria bacterium]
MQNFVFYNPVRMVFGSGSVASLAELVPEGPVLLVYGTGSIRRNGTYERVLGALSGRRVLEFGGIRPNPPYEKLVEGVAMARAEGVAFLLAVGGGSVIDGAKFIAAAVPFEGDPWDLPGRRLTPRSALPLGTVLTLPATGSEMNNIAVISRDSTREKFGFSGDVMFPRFSILDPDLTLSLPSRQIRNGVVDAFVHVIEQYMTYPVNTPLQDRQAEAILLTLMEEGPKTLADPGDRDARANVMWCAANALNGSLKCGTVADFATHRIGHDLTALYGLEHAESLGSLMLALWQHERQRKGEKLAQYASRVLGARETSRETLVDRAIGETRTFFESLGMPTRLTDFGVDPEDAARQLGNRCRQRGATYGEHDDIGPEEIAQLMRLCG